MTTTASAEDTQAQIIEFVQKVVSVAPPLSEEQRCRIAALIRAGGAA